VDVRWHRRLAHEPPATQVVSIAVNWLLILLIAYVVALPLGYCIGYVIGWWLVNSP
jgi:hypothetical protein